ncbi:MAG: hypothetical protein PVG89_02095 [Gammaproteobacteria bacterium]|jgi:hypothetical protein
MIQKNKIMIVASLILLLTLNACSNGGDNNGNTNFTTLACTSTANDSSYNGSTIDRIHSEDVPPNTYEEIIDVRTGVNIDYMVHTHPSPKALLILIAGGQLNAQIEGTDGNQATNASGNFLVRSAHLFAQQGYKVVTIDRPSDYLDYTLGSTSGRALDNYRTSSTHFTDLQAIIAAENSTLGLPVAIAGTSRGTISAVAQHNIADYVLLSAPITTGNGSPIGTAGVMPSDVGSKPVHIMWHAQDGCFVSPPENAINLVDDFTNATGVQVTGGINHPELATRLNNKECDGSKTYHGFSGIESCVVENATDWLDQQLNM